MIKAIHAVKGRNSIIVAPHPRAKLTNKKICDLMRDAIEKMGAPADLVIAIEIPSLETTNELMQQCDRVLATGVAPWSQQHTRAERLLWALVLERSRYGGRYGRPR